MKIKNVIKINRPDIMVDLKKIIFQEFKESNDIQLIIEYKIMEYLVRKGEV